MEQTHGTSSLNVTMTNNNNNNHGASMLMNAGTLVATTNAGAISMDSYEDVFKEITKKLYGDEGIPTTEVIVDSSGTNTGQNIVYEATDFRTDGGNIVQQSSGGLTLVTAPNGLPHGTIFLQRRIQDDKGRIWTIEGIPQGEQLAFATMAPNTTVQQLEQATQQQQQQQSIVTTLPLGTTIAAPPVQHIEERWFESEETLAWTTSRIARYNPTQKVFRCIDCDFVGFLSRVAEHWLGNHASLRVFQCPRCPYTSAWARCVRMHLSRQHGETLADNSLWKENPVLEEVTKFLTTLKTKVESKNETVPGEKRYSCKHCSYSTDRRDLFNRHENIHRDEKPFQCYVCEKQFNRADHVKKHFTRMHRDHTYDINKIRKNMPKTYGGTLPIFQPSQNTSTVNSSSATTSNSKTMVKSMDKKVAVATSSIQNSTVATLALQVTPDQNQQTIISGLSGTETVTLQQIPHIAFFNPPAAPGQTGPLQGITGVGGTKKEVKSKGQKKKKSGEKMYTCSYCPWQGVDNWCLKRHLNTHIKPFLCALCDYKAARSERLATHVLKVHNKRVCHKCSFLADDTESLGVHIQESHQNPLVKTGYNCNVCHEYFELRADLEAHAILEHQKVIVQCDLCDFRTTDELSMEAHLRDKHNLQPGMGAVAAAAAAAAAAASGNQPELMQQIQLAEPTQNLMETDLNSVQISKDCLLPQNAILPDGSSGLIFQDSTGSIIDGTNLLSGVISTTVDASMEPAVLECEEKPDIEPEEEPNTMCEKCGVDFANETSLRLHEKLHVPINENSSSVPKPLTEKNWKSVGRDYICSLCSYTCYTQNNMLQHLRAHTGFELICKADKCDFSTPFENTLKEHIATEHANEPFIRCPHCGLKISSINIFTIHWRFHHSTLCSLCVNTYKTKCGLKEESIHDWTVKTPLQLLCGEQQIAAALKTEPQSDPTMNPKSEAESTEKTASGPPSLKEDMPKKPKTNLSSIYKRESLKFLPKLSEIVVSIVPPKKNCPKKPVLSSVEYLRSKLLKQKGLTSKSIRRGVRKLLKKRKEKGIHVPSVRRFSPKGSLVWVCRNITTGYKCHNIKCVDRSWKFPTKSARYLHEFWFHSFSSSNFFQCDSCEQCFKHLYQAFLHKLKHHPVFKNEMKTCGVSGVNSTTVTCLEQSNLFQFTHHQSQTTV